MELLSGQPGRPPDLRCVVASPSEEVAVVQLVGEIDCANADWLAELLHTVLLAGWAVIRLDMSEVSFLDSAGLTVIERSTLDAQLAHQQLSVVRPSEPARRVIELLGSGWVLER